MRKITFLLAAIFGGFFASAQNCGELYFSEYIEGSSNNKGFEIYNPTSSTVSLSGYTVYLSGNGGSYTNTFTTSASIAPYDVYLIATNQADSLMQFQADTVLGYPSVSHFNGDDALILVKSTDTLDVIGVPGVDPGSSWTVGTGSTANYTLVRKATVTGGSTDWSTGAGEWDVYAQNTYSYFGSHGSSCSPVDVTFQVDMNNVSASYTNVYVSGTLNSWSGNSNQLTDADGDGVYDGTISLLPGSYEYKFTYDNWTGQESLDPNSADSTCTLTTSGYTNRYITIGAADTTLPQVCWEECVACLNTVDVTFQVDMNNVSASYTNVYISGTINGWSGNANQMTDADSDGVYDVTLTLNPGSYEYKFTYDNWTGQESLDPTADAACTMTTSGYTNRVVATGTADTTLPVVCWESCLSCNAVTPCSELFFSEYAEGSSNHKYIEIYNPTGSAISLSGYTIYASGNGGSWTNSFTSNATIASGDVYMIANSSLDSATQSLADTSLSYPSIVHYNGDDALILVSGTDTIDVIGVPGVDPGSSWTVGTGSTANHTLVRKATVDMGSTDWTTGAGEWDVYASNTWTYSGAHSSNCLVQTDFVVTFMVNTANITVGSNGLYLGGGVIGGANAVQLLDPDNDGIYVGTDTLNGSNGGNFIFLNSPSNASDWGTKENLAGLSCADPNNYNDRILPTFSQDTTLMFCFGTCSTDTSCTVTTTNPDVTFQVDMNNVSASYTNVYISGTMNGWSGNANQMSDADGDGVYDITLTLAPAAYEYKFTYDNWTGQESLDPTVDSACTLTTGIYTNRYSVIGSADTTLPAVCWEECSTCMVAPSGCDELFFSEYAEGSSNNKYIEIYNPTANAISLSGYTVYQSGNGGSYTNTFTTSATIASGDVYMIAANQADASILAVADTAMAYPSIAHFNGDDAMILTYGTDTIDVIGVPGVDPGSSWTVGTGSTANHTLVRKATITGGSTDWSTGAGEWDVYASNTWTYMGAHSSNCIYVAPTPTFDSIVAISTITGIDASGVADSLGASKWIKGIVTTIDFDGNGGYSFYVSDSTDGINIYNFADKSGYTSPMMGDSLIMYGSVAQYNGLTELIVDSIYYIAGGYTLPTSTVVTALDETTESEIVTLVGFNLVDPTQWPSTGSSANVDITNGTDTLTMRIDSDTDIDGSPAPAGTFDVTGVGSQYDNSSPYTEGYQLFPRMLTDIFEYPFIPTYTIGQVDGIDADGVPDSLNVYCKVEGIVMGVDMQGSATAVSFTVHDGTDGLGTYSSVPTAAAYNVTEGDEVRIIGSIGHFNGLLQMYLDSVVVLSTGNTLQSPTVITSLGESTESELIKFENATMVDPTQWGSGSSGYTIDITNGTDTIVMRIDADVDLYGTTAPTGAFDVVGIGGQYDWSAPHDEGYQLLPRYIADITPAAAVWVPEIVVSEIMAGSNSTGYNADWFEIYNYGDTVVNIGGFSWDDESDISGTSVFPSVTIAPGEAIVVLDDISTNKDAFLAEWKLYPGSVTIVANDELTGSFPSLSQNGDGVYLYDASGAALTNSLYSAATAGYSVEFDTTGAFTGDAVDGTNGAYTSLEGDVGSPGNLTPNSNVNEQSIVRNIYPNPTTGMFTVELGVELEYTVQIVNMMGETLAVEQGVGSMVRMDLNAAAGTYLVKVVTDRGTQTLRVVLQ
jgi:predicted extracellular nuclease